ncbi:MAG: acyltransferase [Vicinamibacterales bacterium]
MASKRFKTWQAPTIEHGKLTEWNWLVQHPQNLELGQETDIGAFTYINAQHGVVIEDRVQVGSHCSIYSVSTIDDRKGTVTLRQNCRVGSHSTIMPGVTIGENSIIGAHSFVNSDIPNDVVAFGCPARIARANPQSPRQGPEGNDGTLRA